MKVGILLFVVASFMLLACDPEEMPEPVALRAELVRVYDIATKPDEPFTVSKRDGYYRCSFWTVLHKTGQKEETIRRLTANYAGNRLSIIVEKINSEFPPGEIYRKVMVDFNLYGLPSGEYEVYVSDAVIPQGTKWVFE